MKLTLELLRRFAGARAKDDILRAIVQRQDVLTKYGINTPLRLQHFFAQVAHESGGFTIQEENLNYTTVARLRKVWPGRFKSDAAAKLFVRNPLLLGSAVYANRMGNGSAASGDGYRYRGRGLAQHTGKDGYAQVAKITGLPLIENPELVNDPVRTLECAAAFWQWKKLAPDADRDDITAVTKKWNGGTVGLAERKSWLTKARKAFTEDLDAPSGLAVFAPLPPDRPVGANPDDQGVPPGGDPDVFLVQTRLKTMGYTPGEIDGLWGGQTAGAVAGFLNDIPVTPPFSAPVSAADFKKVLPQLNTLLANATKKGFSRPISEERATATPAELAPKLPEVAAARAAEKTGFWAAVTGGVSAAGTAIVKGLGDVVEWLQPVKDFAGDVPWYAWTGLAFVVSGVVYFASRQAGQAKDAATDAYQSGERL